MAPVLEVDRISKAFGSITALDDVGFEIVGSGMYGLIGPNGAGKTTLFDVICGRQYPDSGRINFRGKSIDSLRSHRRARLGFARTFQECRVLPQETCLDNILFAAQDKRLGRELITAFSRNFRDRAVNLEEARRLLRLINLERYASSPAGVLSYGQRRLLEIASTLITRPQVLMLDEPASGVNPTLLNTLHDFLKAMFVERPIVMLIVEHNMEFIMSLASWIIVMHQGRVLEQGTPAAIQANERVVEAYLG